MKFSGGGGGRVGYMSLGVTKRCYFCRLEGAVMLNMFNVEEQPN